MSEMKRTGFSSKMGIVLATAGSAVGLGNIWRFPYMTGMNGGAAFILFYILFVLMLGVPGMMAEFVVGRSAESNAARAYNKLAGKTPCVVKDLPSGSNCQVRLVKAGFYEAEKEVRIVGNDLTDIDLKLKKRR